ncbi:MAG: hypothetical protein PHO80_05620, partial [Candidatus Gracilibacteria bacterium]|nr:hypothetical protein [Candidatus Gracilibacteria bacterium]
KTYNVLDQDLYISNNDITLLDSNKISYITGELLIKLLASVSINKEVEDLLFHYIFSNSLKHPRLLFYIGIYYGVIDKFLDSLNTSQLYNSRGILFIKLFDDFFENFVVYFNQKQLSIILNLIRGQQQFAHNPVSGFFDVSNSLIKKIINHRFGDLSKNIIGINIEINNDKEEVKRIVSYLGFDSKYNEFLTDLDKHFYSTNKDSIEIAGLIGNFRQFCCDLIIDIALEVAKLNGLTDIPKSQKTGTSKIGDARYYLKTEFQLSDNEHKFLNNFIDILHAEGGHTFLSSMEYFRLTKNIFIEIVLLLLSKLKDLKRE